MLTGLCVSIPHTGPLSLSHHDQEDEEEEADTHHLDTAVFVRVEFTDESAPVTMWSHSDFMDRLFLMRELYTTFIECGRDLAAAQATMPTDPFYVKPEAQVWLTHLGIQDT